MPAARQLHKLTAPLRPALLAAVLMLSNCQASKPESMDVSTAAVHPTDLPPASVSPTSANLGEITIIGNVKEVSLSARYVRLEEPVDGYDLIVLDSDSEVFDVDGSPIDLKEIHTGGIVTASGRLGSSGALIADWIKITPKPDS
jgi:hypothetical protein